MNDLKTPLVIFILGLLAILFVGPPAQGACTMSYCKAEQIVKTRTYIRNTSRQIIGDLYDPGTGRIQIRDTSRRIVGYIERSGRVTNTSRQDIGAINE